MPTQESDGASARTEERRSLDGFVGTLSDLPKLDGVTCWCSTTEPCIKGCGDMAMTSGQWFWCTGCDAAWRRANKD